MAEKQTKLKLGLTDKGRTIKKLFVYWVLLNLTPLKKIYLASLSYPGLLDLNVESLG